MLRLSIWILLFFLSILLHAQSSVLATGNWQKVGVVSSGIYKLDKESLNDMGFADPINPAHLHLYGNEVRMLPQLISEFRPDGLQQHAIYFDGDADDQLEDGEYFLFYGLGPDKLEWGGEKWLYEKNIYSDTAYYFVTLGTENGKRISPKTVVSGATNILDTYLEVIPHEIDEYNLLDYVNSGGSGRQWFGELLIPSIGLVRNFELETPDLVDSIAIELDVIGFAESQTTYDLLLNGSPLGSLLIGASTVSNYSLKGRTANNTFSKSTTGNQQELTVDFIRTEGSIFGFINRFIVSYNRKLIYRDQPCVFNNLFATDSIYRFSIETNTELTIWDITSPTSIEQVATELQSGVLNFEDSSSAFRNYVAFAGANYPSPIVVGSIANQDLRSLQPKDGLIITAPSFLAEAEELAQLHEEHDNLDLEVVTTRQIYNEFSSGMQNVVALRDAIYHYYTRNNSMRYVLLFGDCSFDYKDRVKDNTNFVPIYESRDSWDPVESYSSDDFFGFMDPSEGEWKESETGDHTMEVGIGRLPVKSQTEAKAIVNKIGRYIENASKIGEWKNKVTYLADDGNAGYPDTHTHMEDAEKFADSLWQYAPQLTEEKIYIDAYTQYVDTNVETSPEAREALANTVEEGTFMINFIGHGSAKKWTEETVLDRKLIEEMSNTDRMPVFVTATCEFGRYDDPTLLDDRGESGAEKLILKEDGGAIALLTTTRPVYSFTNFPVNQAFHYYLFKELEDGPEAGNLPRLGDLMRLTKNNSLRGAINRNFSLLGDPMLRLDYPDHKIQLDMINEHPVVEGSLDTLSALERVQITGSIKKYDGSIHSSFSGEMIIKVFDQVTEDLTLGQRDAPFPYHVRENVLFNGKVSVESGRFDVEFIMPKNISYQFGQGAISLYAYNDEKNEDATGGYNQIRIGGSASDATDESNAPEISLYINANGFTSGGVVTRSDTLIAEIIDESGINTTGLGLDRDIVIMIGEESFIVNHSYESALDSYQEGSVRFPLSEILPGSYKATISLYDVHNNQGNATVDFIVSDQPTISLMSVTTYPNPASDFLSLSFDHPRLGETLDISVELISMHGDLVLRKEFVRSNSMSHESGFDISLNQLLLQNGLYFCRLNVKSRLDGAKGMTTKKVIIIN